ncbi:gamma-glutamyltransferase [bacterium LRH843]|nr:gamma-glutamyltransferase [bacterium LRH843]
MLINRKWLLAVFILVLVSCLILFINKEDPSLPFLEQETSPDGFGVSAADPLAVKIGMDVLENGGNAIDAAVAVSYALAVVEPFGSGLGGGGGMVVVPGNGESPVSYDYREIAPRSGEVPEGYVGVPGFVKGLEQVHKDLGSMPMEKLLQPAIDLAEGGFQVSPLLTERLLAASGRLPVNQLEHFFPDGEVINIGETLKQHELANTIKQIQQVGSDAFYNGEIGRKIANRVQGLEIEDFDSYTVLKNEPVEGVFNGYTVYSAPPPFSGLTVIQNLQMAELMGINQVEGGTENFIHLLGEISKQSFQSRNQYIGDLNFTNVPISELRSVEYAKDLSSNVLFDLLSEVSIRDTTPADALDHSDTTHFVIYDEDGMMVSATHSLSNFFGSGIYTEGMFLNNSLMNFSQNSSSPNFLEPGKRPRSFIAPTILVKDDKPVLGIGSPGGTRIPTVISQVLILFMLNDLDLQSAIDAPRFFVEDDTLYLEDQVPDNVKKELKNRGYRVVVRESSAFFGGIQGLYVDQNTNELNGGVDRRRNGAWEKN